MLLRRLAAPAISPGYRITVAHGFVHKRTILIIAGRAAKSILCRVELGAIACEIVDSQDVDWLRTCRQGANSPRG